MSTQLSFWDEDFNPASMLFADLTPAPTPIEATVSVVATDVVASVEPEIITAEDSLESDFGESPAAATRSKPSTYLATGAVQALAVRTHAPWPFLDIATHDDLRGEVTKFNANTAAIEMLHTLEKFRRAPTDSERAVLNRYTGWGGIKQPFDKWPAAEWTQRARQLKSLLSDSEFESAAGSTLNAHFTPLKLVDKIWSLLRHCGFKGGRIIEPSGGIGYFLGSMPSDIAKASDVTAVELDSLSARILTALYGHEATVLHTGFEKANLPESHFDLAISNVPFGDYSVGDLRRKSYSDFSIHNYFIARSLDLVRPGGFVAVLTSAFFMDANKQTVRKMIAHRAKLVGAFRLPSGTFSQIAKTEVVVDFVLLQRRDAMDLLTADEADEFVPIEPLTDDGGIPFQTLNGLPFHLNSYWNKNPDRIIGEWQRKTRQHGQGFVPVLDEDQDLYAKLDEVTTSFPANIYLEPVTRTQEVELEIVKDESTPLHGSIVLRDSLLHLFDGHRYAPLPTKGVRAERTKGLVQIRDTAKALIAAMSKINGDEAHITSLRYKLNVLYDAFILKHGVITSTGNRLAMKRDPSWPLLLSLEVFDQETLGFKKADIFFERTIFSKAAPISADTDEDALAICVAELGCVDSSYIGLLLGKDGNLVLESLVQKSMLFVDPETLAYKTRTEYLSGNVRKKLELAVAAGLTFEPNAAALTASIPKDLLPSQIDVMPGMLWIPNSDNTDFLKHLYVEDYGSYEHARYEVTMNASTSVFAVDISGPPASNSTARWGTRRFSPAVIFKAVLNSEDLTAYDQTESGQVINHSETAAVRLRQDEMRTEYKKWIWTDTARAVRLARIYNDEYNCWAPPVYDGSYLRLPGYSHSLAPRAHQLNAVARMATGNNTILAHDVGAGKTLTMCIGTMELKRLGIIRKPWHVVQNSTLEQYCAEFIRAYPGAQILMATKDDLKKEKRKEFIARCATGTWDAVVITHSSFEKIAADRDIVESFITQSLDEMKASLEACTDRTAQRAMRKAIKDWEAKLEKMEASWKKDDFIPLSMTGVDYLAIDEAHVAKNLFRVSRMKNITGLNNSNSQRALDMFLKCKQIMRLHGDAERGVTLASGTLVSNSIAELHVFQRFVQPKTLAAAGLDQFDAWAAQFGRAVNSLEVAPDGSSFRMQKRFKQFANVPELVSLLKMVADIQTKEMLALPVPPLLTGGEQTVIIEPSESAREFVKKLVERAEAISKGAVKPDEDNMLSVCSDGAKVALDERLVMPELPFNENGKIAKCVENVHRIWEMTASFRGTQLIFMDRGTPKGKGMNLYAEIKKLLIAKGVPSHEIAFIHDAESDSAKSFLFSKVRSGLVRVLIGSTEKCGTGTNVQTRLYALHHLTVPWRPADLIQRNGRIERQGNTCEAIEIWRYATSAGFDVFQWQTLSAKAGFISQIFAGNAEIRTIEDAMMATLTYEEVKSLACGNPAVREKAQLDSEIMQLALQRRQFSDAVWSAKSDLQRLPIVVSTKREEALVYGQWAEEVLTAKAAGLKLVVAGKQFTEQELVTDILNLSIEEAVKQISTKDFKGAVVLGQLNGVQIEMRPHWGEFKQFAIKGALSVALGSYTTGQGLMKGLDRLLPHLQDTAEKAENAANYWRDRQPGLEKLVSTPFHSEELFNSKVARSQEIAISLGLLKDMAGTSAIDDSTAISSELASDVATATDAEPDEETEELEVV